MMVISTVLRPPRRITWSTLAALVMLAGLLYACGQQQPTPTPQPAAPAAPPPSAVPIEASTPAPRPTPIPAPTASLTPPTIIPTAVPATSSPIPTPEPETPTPAPAVTIGQPTPRPPATQQVQPTAQPYTGSTAILWGTLVDQLSAAEQECITSEMGNDLLREVREQPVSPEEPEWGTALFSCLTPDTALVFPGAMLFSLMVNEVLLGTADGDEIPPDTKECIQSLLADTDVGEVIAAALQDPTAGQMPNQAVMEFAAGIESCAPQPTGLIGPPDEGHPTLSATSILWQFTVPGWAMNSPTVSDGVVYVGADDANVYALDAANGALLWSFETGDVVRSPATVSNGVVYIGSNDNILYALDAETGNLLWQHDTGDSVRYAPLVVGNSVYVPTVSEGGRNVHALDASSGTQLWVASQYYPFDSGFESGIGAASDSDGDLLLVIDDTRELHALDAQTGELTWSFSGDVGTDTPPVVIGDLVYVTAVNTAYALDLLTGAELWEYSTERFPARGFAPVIDSGMYYFAPDDHVFALDITTGEPVWTLGLDEMARTAPVVADGMVYVASESGVFYALDQQTGEVRWILDSMLNMGTLESPSVADGVLYLESSDGYLLAHDATTGEELWGFNKGFFSGIRTYTLSDGVVYFSSLNGAIYAIDASAAAMR